MGNKLSRYVCTLWIMSAIFSAARYIAAALLATTDGWRIALDTMGPFLPIMSTVCLAGGTVLLIAEAVLEYRSNKKNKE